MVGGTHFSLNADPEDRTHSHACWPTGNNPHIHFCQWVKGRAVFFFFFFFVKLKGLFRQSSSGMGVFPHHLVGPVVIASASTAAGLGSIPAFGVDLFLGQVIPMTENLMIQWLTCQAPCLMGSALGQVEPMSVYCQWVR